MEPAEKKQRTDEAPDGEEPEAKPGAEKPAEPVQKETEGDAPACTKPKLKERVEFLVQDTTLNVLHCTQSNVLMSLTDGGIQHLLAGARANAGVSSGRYMFEVKIIEFQSVPDSSYYNQQTQGLVRNLLRVGFATSSSSLILGESPDSVCFDSQGLFVHNKSQSQAGHAFSRDSVVAVVLNLDSSSPNYNTVSLFKDGIRMCPPQNLPDTLKGKPLFPAVTFKNCTVHVHFGPTPLIPLPFRCRMIGDATKTDATVVKAQTPADGKYEVLFPVGLPDEGTFDWLDGFLAQNPGFSELSDRMILDWADKSGLGKPRTYGQGPAARTCNDKPDMKFGIRELDDQSIQKTLYEIAPLQQRNYVIMEVRGNLLRSERETLLERFKFPGFKTVAHIVVGEPPAEYKQRVQEDLLRVKQAMVTKSYELRKLERERQRALEKARKRMEKEKQKAEEEARKAAEMKAEDPEGKQEESAGDAEKGKEAETKEEESGNEDVGETEEPPPKAVLTEDEKQMTFRKHEVPDLTPAMLSASFGSFSLPEKSEGFDDIRYEWLKGAKSTEYVKQWIAHRKLTMRIEDLTPSPWFGQKLSEWQRTLAEWHSKQNMYKTTQFRRLSEKEARKRARAKAAADKQLRAQMEQQAKAAQEAEAAEKKKAEGEEQAGEAGEKAESKPVEGAEEISKAAEEGEKKVDADAAADEKERDLEEKLAEEEAAADAEDAKMAADFDNLDVFGADDITDVCGGAPMFKDFQFEDWTLMSLGFELHLLAHAFAHDVNDPDRLGIHMDNVAFYYRKYFKKDLNVREFGCESLRQLVSLVEDIVEVSDKDVLTPQIDADMESPAVFAKIVEEARRYRAVRIDLGDSEAALKLALASPMAPAVHVGGYKGNQFKGGGAFNQKGFGKVPYQGKGKGGCHYGAGPYSRGGKDFGARDFGGKDFGGKDFGKDGSKGMKGLQVGQVSQVAGGGWGAQRWKGGGGKF